MEFKNYKRLNQLDIKINLNNKVLNKFQKNLKNKKQITSNKSIGSTKMKRKKFQENLKKNNILQSLIGNDIYFFQLIYISYLHLFIFLIKIN